MSSDDSSGNSLAECPADTERAGLENVCEGCPGQVYCRTQGGKDPDQEFIDVRMGVIKHKILVLSGKGGVGKSTLSSMLALAFSSSSSSSSVSSKVGIVDLDICGPSIPKLLAVERQSIINSPYGWKPLVSPYNDVKVMSVGSLLQSDSSSVVFRGPRKTGLIKRFLKDTYWGKLDFLIFDTPPGTSDEHMSIVKMLKNVKPDGAIIVTTPQEVALATICKEINFCKKMGLKVLGLVENMESFICPCCEEQTELFPSVGVEKLAAKYNIPVLGKLPIDPRISSCCEVGENPFEKYPDLVVTRGVAEIAKTISNLTVK